MILEKLYLQFLILRPTFVLSPFPQEIRIRTEQHMTSKTAWLKAAVRRLAKLPVAFVLSVAVKIFATRWQPRLKTTPNPEWRDKDFSWI